MAKKKVKKAPKKKLTVAQAKANIEKAEAESEAVSAYVKPAEFTDEDELRLNTLIKDRLQIEKEKRLKAFKELHFLAREGIINNLRMQKYCEEFNYKLIVQESEEEKNLEMKRDLWNTFQQQPRHRAHDPTLERTELYCDTEISIRGESLTLEDFEKAHTDKTMEEEMLNGDE